ncbi:hypothetical protein BB560_003234 [Smittium megazygosporum]|uniref:Uncharacterized protein n=1 Tax=Smittium megazygosporum TaxID=133381 RepID=A0A2T9ZCQ0_9FUNG|nr:hypothetical protein BB560_003234 [Smittium megazygosporum]
MKCNHCQEKTESFVTVCATDEVEISGSRGTANYVSKCKFCKREGVCWLEPVEFSPRGDWKALGLESDTIFNEIEFIDNEWADYDEKASNEVSIMDIHSRFSKY